MLDEDGPADVTTDTIARRRDTCEAAFLAEGDFVLAGVAYAEAVAGAAGAVITWDQPEGTPVAAGRSFGVVRGPVHGILRAERPILNVLQRAGGIATITHRFVDAVRDTGCVILHTRKTAPGLRLFDVAAVVAGGGALHRLGLDRIALVKDNHWEALAATGRQLGDFCRAARAGGAEAVYVEVESTEQVERACRAGADRLLIDNQPVPMFATLATHARALRPDVAIEATGGITLATVRGYAEAGAHFVSVGALTHSPVGAPLTLAYRKP